MAANALTGKGSETLGMVELGANKTAPGGALTPDSQGLADWIGVD